MTVCIAAICAAGDDDSAIILCADRLVSSGLGSADNAFKHHFLPAGWVLSVAWSSEGDKNSLVQCLKNSFFGYWRVADNHLDETNVSGLITKAISAWKADRCEELTQLEWGMSYAEFRSSAKEMLPEDLYYQAMHKIKNIAPDVAFIVSGFSHAGFPLLYEFKSGRLTTNDGYAIVGSGEYLAHAAFMRLEYSDVWPFIPAVNAVFTAKKHAEGERHVGRDTLICVQTKDTRRDYVSGEGIEALEQAYQQRELSQPDPLAFDVRPHIMRAKSERDAASGGES